VVGAKRDHLADAIGVAPREIEAEIAAVTPAHDVRSLDLERVYHVDDVALIIS
jgi:hypothetical protein